MTERIKFVAGIVFRCSLLSHAIAGITVYILTTSLCAIAVAIGIEVLPHVERHGDPPVIDVISGCFHFDAFHYEDIVKNGYSYDPGRSSIIAFFPVYPLVAQVGRLITGWSAQPTLLVVANLSLLISFIMLSIYLRSRYIKSFTMNSFVILAILGVVPTGLFFRMPYSESTFLFITLLAMIGVSRHWPLVVTALLAGTATGVRPVGVAVTAAFLWYILFDKECGSIKRRLIIAVVYLPLACWGLLAYMTYQYIAFDAPLAFAQTQAHWTELHGPSRGTWDQVESLVSLEPIWGAYTSDPERTWQRPDTSSNPLFNLFFWNPIFFVGTAVLIFIGARKSWLTGPEIVLSVLLLAIPYVTRAYEMCMASHARFAAVVFPAYIVLGRLLGSLPPWVTWAVIGAFTMMLMTWTALYAAGHLFF